jgi:hypothetical protein
MWGSKMSNFDGLDIRGLPGVKVISRKSGLMRVKIDKQTGHAKIKSIIFEKAGSKEHGQVV